VRSRDLCTADQKEGWTVAIIVELSENPLGELAIERAIAEATLRKQPIVLTSTVGLPRSERAMSDYAGREQEVEAALERKSHQLRDRGVDCETYLPTTPTDSADAVVEAAQGRDDALIVLGIRRRSPVGKLVLGSVAQDVILQADCPVLAVKLPPELEDRR